MNCSCWSPPIYNPPIRKTMILRLRILVYSVIFHSFIELCFPPILFIHQSFKIFHWNPYKLLTNVTKFCTFFCDIDWFNHGVLILSYLWYILFMSVRSLNPISFCLFHLYLSMKNYIRISPINWIFFWIRNSYKLIIIIIIWIKYYN